MWYESEDWRAYRFSEAGHGRGLRIEGRISVGNPGVAARLERTGVADVGPSVLNLRLSLEQRPGMWIQRVSSIRVGFQLSASEDAEAISRVTVTDEAGGIRLIAIGTAPTSEPGALE